jgi:rhamnosyltransferase subunit B
VNILLPALGSAGDVHPVLAVGRSLQARGHAVTVLTDAHFRPRVERAGLTFATCGPAGLYDRLVANADLWHATRSFATIAREALVPLARPTLDFIRDTRPDLVAASALCLGARVAHEALGVPTASLYVQPMMMRSAEDPPAQGFFGAPAWTPRWAMEGVYHLVDRFLLDAPLEGVMELRRDLGLPPVRGLMGRWNASPQGVVGLFPEWFARTPSDWPRPLALTGFVDGDDAVATDLPAELRAFLDAGPPPVVVTFGSAMRHAHATYAQVTSALRARGERVVALAGDASQLPSPSEGVLGVPWAPLGALLERSRAIVHHGGIGTAARGLAAGVPQLLVPHAHDQFDNLKHLRRLGVATGWDKARTAALGSALAQVLDDGRLAEQARALAPRCATDAAERAADALEAVARGEAAAGAVA